MIAIIKKWNKNKKNMKNLKQLLNFKNYKQVDLAKKLKVRTSALSLHVNGVQALPVKYHGKFCKILGITNTQHNTLFVKSYVRR